MAEGLRIAFEHPSPDLWTATAKTRDGDVVTVCGATVLEARIALDEAIRKLAEKAAG